jgi:hypothetical protein
MRPIPLLLIALLPLSLKATLADPVAAIVPAQVVTMTAHMEQPVCLEGHPVVLVLALHNGGTQSVILGTIGESQFPYKFPIRDELVPLHGRIDG